MPESYASDPTHWGPVDWSCLYEVFGAQKNTTIGEPDLPCPINMSAKHLGWGKAGKGNPMVKVNWWMSRHSNGSIKHGGENVLISGLALLWAMAKSQAMNKWKDRRLVESRSLPPEITQCIQGRGGPLFLSFPKGKTPRDFNISQHKKKNIKIRMYTCVLYWYTSTLEESMMHNSFPFNVSRGSPHAIIYLFYACCDPEQFECIAKLLMNNTF